MNSKSRFVKLSGLILVAALLTFGIINKEGVQASPLAQATSTEPATQPATQPATEPATQAATVAPSQTALVVTATPSVTAVAPTATTVPAVQPTNTVAAVVPAQTTTTSGVARCVPAEVAVFANSPRIHVKCTSPTDNILYFAVGTTDAGLADRVLQVALSAFNAGHALSIAYDPTDLSGTAIGCLNADCRLIISVAEVR